MLRKRAVALALTLLLSPAVLGLGLGALKTTSALNEPFDGRIEVLGATVTDFDTLTVKLADTAQFERAGVPRDAVLLSLKFEIVETESGPDFIRVSSRDPVREPYLNFLLELNWANGRMVREYTVLLDPPLYDPNRRAAAPAPMRTAPAAAPSQAGYPPAAVGVPAPRPGLQAADGTIGPIQATDTLWSIASAYRPDATVSVQQMMLALLRANPEAFVDDNVNMLKRGAVLKVPARAEMDSVAQGAALEEIKRQHQLWEEYRRGATTGVTPQPMGPAEAPVTQAGAVESPAADAHLELVAPETGGEAPGAPGSAAGTAPGTELVEEGLTTRAQENAELQAKLTEADQIIDLLQRQVQIKDEELAALQARLAEAGIEHGDIGEAPAAPPEAPAPAPQEVPADVDISVGEAPPVAEAPAPAPPPEAAPPPEHEKTPAPAVVAEEEPARPAGGFLENLIPAHLRAAVPGGATTILGVGGTIAVLLLLFIAKAVLGRRGEAPIVARPQVSAARDDATTKLRAPVDDEPITETRVATVAEDEDATEVADPFQRTLEATTEQLAGDLRQDPLEEVNVYLAYERFDQAEELVKKVIEQYPREHKYKLRLLEIYYSANNKRAYEEAARELYAAVGENDPLWENAVAMWTEMSPERPLFAAGADYEPAAAAAPVGASKAFVDITGEASPAGATISMALGGAAILETTQVSLSNDPGAVSGLDFDLGTQAQEAQAPEPVLDLTAGEPEAQDTMIDLTATADESDILDLTLGDADQTAPFNEIFDISAEAADTTRDDMSLDFTASVAAGNADLLDITKTGNLAFEPGEELLNVTAPGLMDTRPSVVTPPAAAGDDAMLEFDISDTVSPPFDAQAEPSFADTDAEAGARPPEADDALDFDITGLQTAGDEGDITIETDGADLDFALDLGATPAADRGLDLEFDAEASVDLELSLQNPELDDLELAPVAEAPEESDSDIEFDLALQDTTDFENLAVDDTLELPKAATLGAAETTDESLEDLTRSMEASIAGLDLDEEPGDESGMMDLGMESLEEESIDLDFSIDDEVSGGNELDTLALDASELGLDTYVADADKTVIMPRDADIEFQSDADETDTKLNLAKAYMELGDSEGARSILNEVVRQGTGAQQEEARKLLGQMG